MLPYQFNIPRFYRCKNSNFQIKSFSDIFVSSHNIDKGLTSTHNLCLRAQTRKIVYTLPKYNVDLSFTFSRYTKWGSMVLMTKSC